MVRVQGRRGEPAGPLATDARTPEPRGLGGAPASPRPRPRRRPAHDLDARGRARARGPRGRAARPGHARRLRGRGALAALARAGRGGPLAARAEAPPEAVPADLLDAAASQLEFNVRVLAVAEDDRTPLLERLRYLAIVSANLDELYMGGAEDVPAARAEATPYPAARLHRALPGGACGAGASDSGLGRAGAPRARGARTRFQREFSRCSRRARSP